MKLTAEQQERTQMGQGMVYVGKNGAERYIEAVIDVWGNASSDKFYVWNRDRGIDWNFANGCEPMTLEEAKHFVDEMSAE